MATPKASAGRRSRLVLPLLLLPLAMGGLCCWFLLRTPSQADLLPAVGLAESGLEGQLEGIDPSQVEALAIDRRGEVVEIGLLLSKIQVRRTDVGLSQFEAELFNLGDFPVENARVELRLSDAEGQFIDTIVMRSDQLIHIPDRWAHLEGSYQVGGLAPRIVEEKLVLMSDRSISFTTYSYDEVKDSPGLLGDLARVFPFLSYEALWTNPLVDWGSYEIQFALDRVMTD